MVNIVCDACKKSIQGAMKDVNVTYIADKNICMPCKEKLEDKTKADMQKKPSYTLEGYHDTYLKNLYGMCR